MSVPISLSNQTALITGGGTGIGLGIARCMVKAGARVVLVGRREAVLTQACAGLGSQATFVTHDITRMGAVGDLVSAAEKVAGQSITILVNNAGTHFKKSVVETKPEDLTAMLETHVVAAHVLSQAFVPGMIARGHGSILFISSMAAFMGVPQVMAYSAAKSAYFGMVATMSAEFAPHGVRVNAIAPGWIHSDMTQKALDQDPARKARVFSRIQMGHMGKPDDIGWAAVYLSSPAAAYVTGVTLPVDGGAAVAF